MNKQIKNLILILGIIALVFSIYQAVILKQAHFYSLFSIGAFVILLYLYNYVTKENPFKSWKAKEYIIFIGLLIIASITIDRLGIFLGYWTYPKYDSFSDELIKFIFEWTLALSYIMVSLMIGIKLFNKLKLNNILSFVLSLLIFVTLTGLLTELVNMQAYSWQVLSMPLTNYKIGNLFLVWHTIGYWLMAIIPYLLYKFVDNLKK